MSQKKRLLAVGGGTAGHVSPILAVLSALVPMAAKQGIELEVHYAGLVSDAQFPIWDSLDFPVVKHSLIAGKLHRHITVDQVRQLSRAVWGLGQARRLVAAVAPDLVFAKGGYVSVPTVLAAARKQIPIFCHETDVRLGMANKVVAKHARTVFTAFPESAYTELEKGRAKFVGQPVRPEFYHLVSGDLVLDGRRVDPSLPLVSIVGGSQGAQAVNDLVAGGWPQLLAETQVVVLAGAKHALDLRKRAATLPPALQKNLWVLPFVGVEFFALLQRSTVVVSRAGGTIAELAAVGAASILIPLPTAAQDHQRANAQVLVEAGAAVAYEQASLTSESLSHHVLGLVHNSAQREALSGAIKAFDHPKAAQEMAAVMLDNLLD